MNPSHRRRHLRRAFSLVELIVAISIMAILVALVVPKLGNWIGFAKAKTAAADAETISQQVRMYLSSKGLNRVPPDFQLMELTEGTDPLLTPSQLRDPWDNEYQIRIPGTVNIDYDIYSYGADGQPGGEGDDADVVAGEKKK